MVIQPKYVHYHTNILFFDPWTSLCLFSNIGRKRTYMNNVTLHLYLLFIESFVENLTYEDNNS